MTPTPPSLSSFAGWGLEGGAFFYKSDAARPGTRSTQVSPVRAIPAQRPPTTLPPPSNFSFKLRERARGGRGGSPQAKAATTTPSSLPHSLSPHHTHTRAFGQSKFKARLGTQGSGGTDRGRAGAGRQERPPRVLSPSPRRGRSGRSGRPPPRRRRGRRRGRRAAAAPAAVVPAVVPAAAPKSVCECV